MAIQNPTNSQSENTAVLATEDNSSAQGVKRSKQVANDKRSKQARFEHFMLLEDSIVRVALKFAAENYPEDRIWDELADLTAMRFEAHRSDIEYLPLFIARIAVEAHRSGAESTREVKQGNASTDVPVSALAAIATADHDCPGIHSSEKA